MGDVSKILITSLVTMCMGCAMCESSLDNDFHAYGGMRDRIDRVHGRVGSIFDPASAQPSAPYEEPALPPIDDRRGSGAGGRPEDGTVEDSGITQDLLDGLKKFGELPPVPEVDGESGDDQSDSFNLDFDEL